MDPDAKFTKEQVSNPILPSSYRSLPKKSFEARVGQVNEWTIPLPDELINAVREALKVDPTAKAKPPAPLCRPMTRNDPMEFRETLSALLPRPGMTSRPACGKTSWTSWRTI